MSNNIAVRSEPDTPQGIGAVEAPSADVGGRLLPGSAMVSKTPRTDMQNVAGVTDIPLISLFQGCIWDSGVEWHERNAGTTAGRYAEPD